MVEPQWFGVYEVIDCLGRGGMGAVYRVRHRGLGVERALKVMGRPSDAKQLARFEREALALAALKHPNVVQLHEAGTANGQPYFVMDMVEGEPLTDLLRRGRLDWRWGIELASRICDGVQALHEVGRVHRDLKPDNVMVARGEQPVVIDLGLVVAPETDDRLTQSGTFLGTIQYMAPEQIHGERGSPQSDVYALGLIAFELATGGTAVPQGGSTPEVIGALLTQTRPLPSSVDPTLPAALDQVLRAATHPDLERRPVNAAALATALRQVREYPGPSARSRSQRKLAALGVGLAVATMAGGIAWALRAEAPAPAPPKSTPASVPTASSPAVAKGAAPRAEVERILGEPDPRQRLLRLEAWFDAHPDLAAGTELEPKLDALYRSTPLISEELLEVCGIASYGQEWLVVAASGNRQGLLQQRGRDGALVAVREEPGLLPSAIVVAEPLSLLVVGTYAGGVHGFRLPSFEPAGHKKLSRGRVRALAFSAGRSLLAVGGEDSAEVTLLHLPSLELAHAVPVQPGVTVGALAFSPRGDQLALSDGPRIRLWSLDDRAFEETDRLRGVVRALSFSADGNRLAAVSKAGEAVLFQGGTLRDGERLKSSELGPEDPLFAHRGTAHGLGFGGERLYTAGGDSRRGELHVWDVTTRAQVSDGPRRHHDRELRDVALSPDLRRILVVVDTNTERHKHDLHRIDLWGIRDR